MTLKKVTWTILGSSSSTNIVVILTNEGQTILFYESTLSTLSQRCHNVVVKTSPKYNFKNYYYSVGLLCLVKLYWGICGKLFALNMLELISWSMSQHAYQLEHMILYQPFTPISYCLPQEG